ncbi:MULTISPECIES: hypothetical protein [Acetobacter]|uniref:Uncharacterized protein n=1 Tax=Acetobacter thailandicus TaxID=1502842 RepID=A0ABT3QBG4_9PROT|nr:MULTISPECIES: hypothetical protein [Acetobacter]MBS0959211.1 hypothetical protein [Acetobacter thailandicus]MBS0980761.1 hypothetical protein [Acetobacter thailandicus]MCX2562606.1 hypothetical protein [Acetobacter thailandicus]NHN94672.1 hypothetical protein [Acetobacter thailandicus]OUJ11724.1 hypothetical protein HK25_12940 [Acetobacter sp. DsW_059]
MSDKTLLNPKKTPKKRTLRQHVLRRLVMVVPLMLLMIGLAKTGFLDKMADRYTFRAESWFNDTALVSHLRLLVTSNGMSHDRPDCLLFIVNGNDPLTASRIDVMQKHSGTCPNPGKELPKLFTLQIDRVNHTIMSDQGSPGEFHPVP